ncbi:Gfo/Idh/MocA family oxidoreductase [bacterium]|nr:Gfo/Idh/MocA family oxidoreductase [bacterium]
MSGKKGIQRRDFLKAASVAAIGAPYIVPSTVFGQNTPSNRFTMGCIGVGNMGTGNMKNFLEREDVQVVAVCDVDRLHRLNAKEIVEQKYAEKMLSGRYKGCDHYNDFRDLIYRKDIDLISIAVPDHWHAIPAIMAANAGKDIYAEKPLALTIAEGRAMSDAVRRNGVVWQTGSWQRSVANFRTACELVRNERIGKLKKIYVGLPTGSAIGSQPEMPVPEGFDYDFWLGQAPLAPYTEKRCHWNFRWILDYSGGQLTDWAAHHCDIAQWGMGTEYTGPVEVEGEGNFPRDGLWNAATEYHFVCTYKNGIVVDVGNNTRPDNKQGVKFIGSDGWVFVSRSEFDAEPKSLLTTVIGKDEIHLYKSENHYANFIDCVRSRELTITPIEVAHRSITIGHLGNISMQLGRKVKWNPDTERFVNDPEADRMLSRAMRSPWTLNMT